MSDGWDPRGLTELSEWAVPPPRTKARRDPYTREIGRLTDSQGRELTIGVSYGTVTLRTLHTRTNGAVELDAIQQEELAQLLITAVRQAAVQTAEARDGIPAAAGGEP